jgi:NADPH-dependent curcumin reductase CurA
VTMPTQNRRWILNARPPDRLTGEESRWNVAPVPRLAEGQVLVWNLWLSSDPGQRTWLLRDAYIPVIQIQRSDLSRHSSRWSPSTFQP